ncbi:MAG TPA: TIGR04053 family radical SAM/SPASM domain-containing protein [Gemmatimonadaceae bacterium]|nr:TIGR04053 family radical SAM/SPASM domain-containing protein [Gemmatimonadaceae bacterium]
MSAHPVGPAGGRPTVAHADFDQAPFLVIWETTQACDLACLHCRACAQPNRDPLELSTGEARRLIDDVRALGNPLFVLTGGDPLKRPDTLPLVEYAASTGLRVAMTPSGTPLMTPEVLRALRDAGLARLAVSVDGATAASHDAFRGVRGSFDWTLRMLREAQRIGLSTQVNTTISRYNVAELDALIALMSDLGITLWSVFFLVPTGRAQARDIVSPDEIERVMERLYALSLTAPFDIKTTAAPHYRRVTLQQQRAARRAGDADTIAGGIGFSLADGIGRGRSVNDGSGFVFISHRGEIFPSGFLPVSAGNVRTDSLGDVYRGHPMFRALRDPDRLHGKCGACEYRTVCGGSRARAYAMTGDWLEADPFCAYMPPRYERMVEQGEAEEPDVYFARRIAGWGLDVFARREKRAGAS